MAGATDLIDYQQHGIAASFAGVFDVYQNLKRASRAYEELRLR